MQRLAFVPLFLVLALTCGALISLVGKLDSELIGRMLTDPEIRFALGLSFATSLISLCVSILIALPSAWAMTRLAFPGKWLFNLLLDMPMVTPPLVTGMGLLLLLGNQGPVSGIAPWISANLFSPLGIIIAQSYVASSILIRSAMSSFASIDTNYVLTGYNLGLPPWKTFFLIEIPLCWRQLAGGCVLALSRCLGEFGATLMLAGATRMKTETLPMAVYLNIASGDFSAAIACACILIASASILLLLIHWFQKPGLPPCSR